MNAENRRHHRVVVRTQFPAPAPVVAAGDRRCSMLNPFLPELNADEPPETGRRPAYRRWLPPLLHALTTVAFLGAAMRVPNIVAVSLCVTAAMVSLGAGVVLGLSAWIFPELPR